MQVEKINGTVLKCAECGAVFIVQNGTPDKCPICDCSKLISAKDAHTNKPSSDRVVVPGHLNGLRVPNAIFRSQSAAAAPASEEVDEQNLAPVIDFESYKNRY